MWSYRGPDVEVVWVKIKIVSFIHSFSFPLSSHLSLPMLGRFTIRKNKPTFLLDSPLYQEVFLGG
jgi:hypothetical protein